MSWLKKYWFFWGVGGTVLLAFALPELGGVVRRIHLTDLAIVLLFFTTGLTLESSSILRQMRNVKVVAASLFVSLFLIPVLAYGLACLLLPPEFAVGVCLIAAAPVTVASGTIMTEIGRGNVPVSLIMCVAGNVAGIFTVPLVLELLLSVGGRIELPALQLLVGLACKMLLPTVLGQLARQRFRDWVDARRAACSVFQQAVILLIIFNALAVSTDRILGAGVAIVGVAAFMVGLHLLILGMNYRIAGLLRFDRTTVVAFTLHVSQKTLGVTYIIWAGFFASRYPLSLIPGIAYHLTQMILDTMVAQHFRSRAPAGTPEPVAGA